MKRYIINKGCIRLVGLLLLILVAAACKKEADEIIGSASINVINMAVDAGSVRVNPGAENKFVWSKASDQVVYGANLTYAAKTGSRTVTVVSATDTTKTYFSRTINLQSVNSLYIAGKVPNIDTLFREERNLPFIDGTKLKPDSSVYIRFVNLSPNSTPLNIMIKSAVSNEVTALAYKGISGFKKYEAKVSTANYIFEIRDVATNTLRLTYTLTPNTYRYRTLSLVIKGLMDPAVTGTNAFGMSIVTYY